MWHGEAPQASVVPRSLHLLGTFVRGNADSSDPALRFLPGRAFPPSSALERLS
jgi:hypothetical protein|eukprot:COSAG06_NODE_654_length_13350_cov_72.384499_1_plen_53_part_00